MYQKTIVKNLQNRKNIFFNCYICLLSQEFKSSKFLSSKTIKFKKKKSYLFVIYKFLYMSTAWFFFFSTVINHHILANSDIKLKLVRVCCDMTKNHLTRKYQNSKKFIAINNLLQ